MGQRERYRFVSYRPALVTLAMTSLAAGIAADILAHPPEGSLLGLLLQTPAPRAPARWTSLGVLVMYATSFSAIFGFFRLVNRLIEPFQVRSGEISIAGGRLELDGHSYAVTGCGVVREKSGRSAVHVFTGERHARVILDRASATEAEIVVRNAAPPRDELRPARFALGSRGSRTAWLELCGMLILFAAGPLLCWRPTVSTMTGLFVLALLIAAGVFVLRARTASVAADRVTVGKVFVELVDVEAVARKGSAVTLTTKSAIGRIEGSNEPQLAALAWRLSLAIGSAPAETRTLLARGTRAPEAWLDGIRRLTRQDYRTTSLSDQNLRTILYDGRSPRSARVAAALLLRDGTSDPRSHAALAAFARTFDDAATRAALEAIAATDLLLTPDVATSILADVE